MPLTASAIGNPYLFTGRRYDPESGNYYYRARIYSPTLGRFLQMDPLGYLDGLNLYTYVGNNPASWVDPWGLRVQIMGDPIQQNYILEQLGLFTFGDLSVDENGMLSRSPSDEDEDIESDIDELIASEKLYRIFAHLYPEGTGRSQTVPTDCGGDIYFDPDTDAIYISGFLDVSRFTPAAELAHELLGRATQIDRGVPHGRPGTKARKLSNNRAMQLANRAFKRMGMKKRTRYY